MNLRSGISSFISAFAVFFLLSSSGKAQSPCTGGEAGGYPCNKIELLGFLSPTELLAEPHHEMWLNDIWGWTDPQTGKEYAIVGMTNGTSFVDVTNPTAPVLLGILPEHHAAEAEGARKSNLASPLHDGAKSIWRDIKVYKNHAFIVSEDAGHGIQIFDLTRLREPGDIPAIFKETANYQGISNAHNIVINAETGLAVAVGATQADIGECNSGGLHMIDISDPVNPVFAGCYEASGYVHDAQCVIYNGPDNEYAGKEICFTSDENAVSLVDVSERENPVLISSGTYEGVAYAHQGWLTEDHRYFISNDELDEREYNHNTRSYIWDMTDLDNPVLIGTYTGPNPSIDHNLYIHNGLVYESNYTSGLRVLSTADIEKGELREVAYFDTYPSNNERVFFGAWSNYPFFESGTIIVSDITNGLFVLRLSLGPILKEPQDYVACVGEDVTFSAESSEENVSYQWQVNDGSGFSVPDNPDLYSQANTNELLISNVTEGIEGYRFRLIVTEVDGTEHISEEAVLNVTNEAPQASFEYKLEKGAILFTNFSENASSFTWDLGNGKVSTAANPVVYYQNAGEFEVRLTAINGCGTDEYTQMVSVLTATDEKSVAQDYKVYPNPAKSFLKVEVPGPSFQLKSIRLYNARGTELMNKEVAGDQSQYLLDVSGLSEGVYFLQFISPKAVINRKVLIKE